MAEEIRDAVQIIRVAYDGIEIAVKIGSGGLQAVKKALDFITGLIDYEKSIGKTSMRKLLMRGGDLQVLEFETKDIKQVEKYAKKYGILYSKLPEVNGKTEIVFHSEAAPRINMLMNKIEHGKISTLDDYLMNGNEEELGNIMKVLNREKKGNGLSHTMEEIMANERLDNLIEKVGMYATSKETISVDNLKAEFKIGQDHAQRLIDQLQTIGFLSKVDDSGNHKVMMDKEAFLDRIRGYQEIATRMRKIAAAKNSSLLDVTLAKTLIAEETETAFKTRIPGTWGENVRFVWFKKDDIIDIYQGKSMLSYIDKDKDYKIYDRNNRQIATIRGQDLFDKHYDKVSEQVRKNAERLASQVRTTDKRKVR